MPENLTALENSKVIQIRFELEILYYQGLFPDLIKAIMFSLQIHTVVNLTMTFGIIFTQCVSKYFCQLTCLVNIHKNPVYSQNRDYYYTTNKHYSPF